jgi:hypothetical protein
VDTGFARQEGSRNSIADPAAAADNQNRSTAEIELMH